MRKRKMLLFVAAGAATLAIGCTKVYANPKQPPPDGPTDAGPPSDGPPGDGRTGDGTSMDASVK